MNSSCVERWIWYLFVATVAWQTRLIVWQADRAFIEWRSASIYLSDIFIVALFAFAIAGLFQGQSPPQPPAKGRQSLIALFLLFVFAAISLFNATQLTVGVYQLIRLAQFILFFLYLRYWALPRFDADRTAVAFVAGALVQAGLGIAQYVLQHDVGLRWMGETLLGPSLRGVAVFFDDTHTKILRAYGTLPHPNVLAAYLTAALGATGWLWLRHGDPRHRWWWVWPASFIILLWAFYLTFSRTIIAAAAIAGVAMFGAAMFRRISKSWPGIATVRRRMIPLIATVIATSVLFAVLLWPQVHARLLLASSDESVQLRLEYARDSLASGGSGLLHLNWFGVGIGQFTTWLARTQPNLPPYYVQPAHDLFLLVYSEIGIFGLLALLVLIAVVFRSAWRTYAGQPLVRLGWVVLLGTFCFIALFDHFFWTLQQGRILWWGLLALAAGGLTGTMGRHGRPH